MIGFLSLFLFSDMQIGSSMQSLPLRSNCIDQIMRLFPEPQQQQTQPPSQPQTQHAQSFGAMPLPATHQELLLQQLHQQQLLKQQQQQSNSSMKPTLPGHQLQPLILHQQQQQQPQSIAMDCDPPALTSTHRGAGRFPKAYIASAAEKTPSQHHQHSAFIDTTTTTSNQHHSVANQHSLSGSASRGFSEFQKKTAASLNLTNQHPQSQRMMETSALPNEHHIITHHRQQPPMIGGLQQQQPHQSPMVFSNLHMFSTGGVANNSANSMVGDVRYMMQDVTLSINPNKGSSASGSSSVGSTSSASLSAAPDGNIAMQIGIGQHSNGGGPVLNDRDDSPMVGVCMRQSPVIIR